MKKDQTVHLNIAVEFGSESKKISKITEKQYCTFLFQVILHIQRY